VPRCSFPEAPQTTLLLFANLRPLLQSLLVLPNMDSDSVSQASARVYAGKNLTQMSAIELLDFLRQQSEILETTCLSDGPLRTAGDLDRHITPKAPGILGAVLYSGGTDRVASSEKPIYSNCVL